MPTYPTDPMWSFPVARSLEFATVVQTSDDGHEQRHMGNTGRESWVLPYPWLNLTERDALIAFFEDRKGSALTFDFPFLGTTYTGCHFDSDRLSFTESENGVISTTIKVCQVTRAADSGTMPATFPALASGNLVQLPYTHERGFDTVVVRTEGGRYTYSKRAASLRTWSAGGTVLTLEDAEALWSIFNRSQGRYRSFGFVDPDSGDEHTGRFAQDSLTWTYSEPGAHSIQVSIQELV